MYPSLPFRSVAVLVAVVCMGVLSPQVLGEGTETLGPAAIAIAPGTGIVAAGVGLTSGQPDTIIIDIPGDVSQALLYWQGVSNSDSGDDTIKVDGSDVVGTLIGGITFIPGPNTYISCFRADITGLVAPGPNELSIDGLDFDRNSDGAGVVAIFDDGSGASDIAVRDGCDFVYINNADSPDFPPGTLQTSVPQTFTFAPAASDRTADLLLFAGDVQTGRPNLIEVTVGATTTEFWNLLASTDGSDWDTIRLTVVVPAGESAVTVEMISAPDGFGRNPASLIWLAAAFSLDEDEEECRCVVIIDEETIDNDIHSIEDAAYGHDVEPDFLINDDDPTEEGNPPLRWNVLFPGDEVLLPGGEVDDEGLFALPEMIEYIDNVVTFPFTDDVGNLIEDSSDWVNAYVNGTLQQDKLDKVKDVMPLRNQDLASLVGRTCVAVVYDSDISMNFEPIYANLQGARYGLFTFTVLDVVRPGSIPESTSDTSLYDLHVRVEPDEDGCLEGSPVTVRDHEPDSIEITRAVYKNSTQKLKVFGTSDFAPGATMTVSIEDFVTEAPMTFNAGKNRYQYVINTAINLDGRRVMISTDAGGAYSAIIR